MRIICLTVAIWFGMVGLVCAEKKQLPPSTTSKLIQLESRVSEVERKWFQIDRKIQSMNNKIFGKDKKKIFSEPKGRNVVIIFHDNQMGSVFRIMEVNYTLVHKGKATNVYKAKRASITAPMKERLKIHQRVLVPGDYVLKVAARVHGHSPVFTYLNGYKLKVDSQMGFRVKAGRPFSIRTIFKDTGGMNIKKRFKIVFKTLR